MIRMHILRRLNRKFNSAQILGCINLLKHAVSIPKSRNFFCLTRISSFSLLAFFLGHCTNVKKADVVVSVKEQKLGLYEQGVLKKTYKISTSKFGLGDRPGSNCTPLGQHQVVAKIGHGLPPGAVLKSRRWNGEVLKPNAPGRDPIVSRILWLKGDESSNRNAFGRFIYIHGTPEERRLGEPASYGCIRMGMKDVVNVFDCVNVGAKVIITLGKLPKSEKSEDKPSEGEASPDDDHVLPVELASMQADTEEKAHSESNEKAGPAKPSLVKPFTSNKKSATSSTSSKANSKSKKPVSKKSLNSGRYEKEKILKKSFSNLRKPGGNHWRITSLQRSPTRRPFRAAVSVCQQRPDARHEGDRYQGRPCRQRLRRNNG